MRLLVVPPSGGVSPLFREPDPSPTVEEVRMLELRRSCPPVTTSMVGARLDSWRRSRAV